MNESIIDKIIDDLRAVGFIADEQDAEAVREIIENRMMAVVAPGDVGAANLRVDDE